MALVRQLQELWLFGQLETAKRGVRTRAELTVEGQQGERDLTAVDMDRVAEETREVLGLLAGLVQQQQ